MSPVATTHFPPTIRSHRGYAPGAAIALMVSLVVGFVLLPALDTAPHVDEVTFDNPNASQVDVDVTSGRMDGWVGVGPIDGEESETVREVFDAGNTWIFRFHGPGEGTSQVTVTRADLESADWTVEIPDLSSN